MTLSAGTRLGAYEILSPLGAGGMGEVYRARDSKLKRDVAVKVLPKSLAADADALARFEREALAVAALSHPNILAIHDFGTHEGMAYAVMELLEGETLRGKLDSGPIAQKQAVDYALQVTKGLSAAHEKGIVHRDLKPENLFVTRDGHLKILDFGLAKKVEAAGAKETEAPTGSRGTEPGTVMGTMGYMSPEQVKGLPVDHRSDIFSFGAILYELLSGKRAFRRDTNAETMAAIMRDEPPELTQSGRNISPALDHIVRHCLEKDRDNRFQSAKDVAFALSEASAPTTTVTSGAQLAASPAGRGKVLIAVAAIVVLAAAGLFLLRRPQRSGGEVGGVKRVAVLPFENLGAPEDDYFADGIADAVRGKLTSLPGLEVIARASSTPYKKTTKTQQEIARELDVHYLLTATVRWQKGGGVNRVQVSPELVEISGVRRARFEVAAAVRRGDYGRVPGSVGHRDEGGAVPGRRARGGRGEAACRKAHGEPGRLRRLSEGRGGVEQPGSQRSAQSAEGACLLRSGRGARPQLRASVGESLVRQFASARQQRTDARVRGACAPGGGKGRRARARPPGWVPGPRHLRTGGFP